jgi:3-deoxy-manno-octulosonate cytidylyltransferase (CMP-KDO synthetase)|tara:strand:- start:4462 stop:5229 length:768 start_codon:yes stop_codon:yes gene_type:complete
MNIVAVIPARMNSSRFPGKPMESLLGMPMIGHCYKRAIMSEILDDVYVATCDSVIYDYIISIGGKAVMTLDSHEMACDRAAEAMFKIEKINKNKIDILLMLQGDEPMVTPKSINEVLKPLINDSKIKIANLYKEINSVHEFEDPNEVKVIMDKSNYAMYFTREPIPSRKKGVLNVPMFKQICSIPFRRDFLLEFSKMNRTPLEIVEGIDMNRILENSQKVKMVYSEDESYSVDSPADISRVIEFLSNDELTKKYI